jgi:hypothetical protein
MAQTFDIRFARSVGLAALFDAASNRFGWKGGGRLSIDAQGMSFAPKRGLGWLRAGRRSQRIPANRIVEVYREGDALRIEFATDEDPRATLPFWARDRDTAAQIVRLLPTLRTIEVEQDADASPAKTRARWVAPVGIAIAIVIVIASAVWVIGMKRPAVDGPANHVASLETDAPAAPDRVHDEPSAAAAPTAAAAGSVPLLDSGAGPHAVEQDDVLTPEQARRAAIVYGPPLAEMDGPPASAPVELDADGFVPMDLPDLEIPPDTMVVRIAPTTLAYTTARGMLGAFEASVTDLTTAYETELARLNRGTLNARAFAGRLDALAMRWRAVGERITGTRKYDEPALAGLRATLLMVVNQQRLFLGGYAAGLRNGDQPTIDRAFKDRARAEEALARARLYVN